MKRWVRNTLLGYGGLVVVAGGLMALAWPCLWRQGYLWQRQYRAVATVDGLPSTSAAVYRSYGGTLLVLGKPLAGLALDEPSTSGDWYYMISPSAGYVCNPHLWEFRLQTGLFVLSQDRAKDIGGTDITNEIKGEGAAAHLVFRRRQYVEFTTTDWLTPTNPQLVSHRRRVSL